ncbi:MAG: YkgJ family cysteine cluster protein [Prolixibacteraceae bacterium]
MDSTTSHIVSKWFEKKYREIDLQLADLSPQCAKGCDWCCYQSIEILNWEEPLILEFINSQLSKRQKNRIKKKLIDWFDYLDQKIPLKPILTTEDVFEKFQQMQGGDRKPCIFLHKHECLIYPVRPISCRTHVAEQKVLGCIENPLQDSSDEATNLRIRILNEIIRKLPSSLELLNFAVAKMFELGYRKRPIEYHTLEAL